MDNLRSLTGFMAPWNRYFLHHGWIHPYLAGPGDRYLLDKDHSGPQAKLMTGETSRQN
jgi:hypothetical protein